MSCRVLILGDMSVRGKRLSEAAKMRVRAGRMLLAGKGCAQAAEAVGVARQTVYTWKALLDEGGIVALRAAPDPGRPARLSDMQLAQVRATLLQSPTEHGFERLHESDITLVFSGLKWQVLDVMRNTRLFDEIGQKYFFATQDQALAAIHEWLGDESKDDLSCNVPSHAQSAAIAPLGLTSKPV